MNVLIVSPHPDDETLGAGGTALRFLDEGNKVSWLNITGIGESNLFSDEMKQKRKKQLEEIVEFYKFTDYINLNLPTTKLDSYDTSVAIDKISTVFKKVLPEIVILPDYNDAHSDHRKVFDWCYACSKTFRYPFIKQILTMEIISETDFGRPEQPFYPNYYIDITEYMDKKIDALQIYDTEMGNPPFPRSIENVKALATLRGSTAGVKYAEAFRMIKCIL